MSRTIFQARQHKAGKAMLKEHEVKYIDAVNRYFLLTPQQINRLLLSGGGLTTLYPLLKDLKERKMLQAVQLGRYSKFGRAPIAYALGSEGRKSLKKLGHEVPTRLRLYSNDDDVPMQRPHTLAVNDFLIAAARAQTPHVRLYRFIHERTINSQKIAITLPNGKVRKIAPDAFLEFRITDSEGRKRACLIHEEDRDNHRRAAWEEKVIANLERMNGVYQEWFGVRHFAFSVHTTGGQDRCEELLAWTEKILLDRAADEVTRNSWYFSSFPTTTDYPHQLFLQPVWYKTFAHRPVPILQVALNSAGEDDTADAIPVLPPRRISDISVKAVEHMVRDEEYAEYLLNRKD